jgi:hypothetical protein
MQRITIPCTLVLMNLFTALPAVAQAPPRVESKAAAPDLDAIRAALKKYEDPYVAVSDGYYSTVGCVVIEKPGAPGQVAYKAGGMGVHFVNMSLVGPVPDPNKPPVLLYEAVGDKLQLAGAEWFVPLATGVKERPVLWGHAFDGPMMGHPPLLPAELTHYDLHVWLYKKNPLGIFASTNPDVKCAGHPYRIAEEAPMLMSEK